MTRLCRFSLCLLALPAMAPDAATAACNLASEQIVASAEFRIANTMVASQHGARFAQRDKSWPMVESFAAMAGHMLGGQVRYLGKSVQRRTMFDCIYQHYQGVLARAAIQAQSDPLEADAVFKKAALGLLEDAQLRRLGVDPQRKYPPIFDMGIAGLWRNQRQPAVGMVVEETDEGRYRCRSFGAAQSGGEQNCVIEQVGEQDFVMSFVMPPFGKQTQPQNVRIPLHLDGDRLASPGPAHSLIYVRDRSADGG